MSHGRWGAVVGDSPDRMPTHPASSSFYSPPLISPPVRTALVNQPSTSTSSPPPVSSAGSNPHKNWEGISDAILKADKGVSADEDPNVGGDQAVNEFFQQIFSSADDDTKRAMMKSYQESGGTTLSTNWDDVSKGRVEVKPPQGSEWKKWAA